MYVDNPRNEIMIRATTDALAGITLRAAAESEGRINQNEGEAY